MSAGAPLELRREAEALAGGLPGLMLAAEQLAATLQLGEHGRRRAGQGDAFWQYRPAHAGDDARRIDWRRSARADATFVRDREWQAAQVLSVWADPSPEMDFTGAPDRPTKAARARLLALATALLGLRAGERVALAGAGPAKGGKTALAPLAEGLLSGPPALNGTGFPAHGRGVILSDFFAPLEPLAAALTEAASRGVRGALVQVLDPVEEDFPYSGRTLFRQVAGGAEHDTRQAADLRARYLERLAERRAEVQALAQRAGWLFTTHRTDRPAAQALLWLHGALGVGR